MNDQTTYGVRMLHTRIWWTVYRLELDIGHCVSGWRYSAVIHIEEIPKAIHYTFKFIPNR